MKLARTLTAEGYTTSLIVVMVAPDEVTQVAPVAMEATPSEEGREIFIPIIHSTAIANIRAKKCNRDGA